MQYDESVICSLDLHASQPNQFDFIFKLNSLSDCKGFLESICQQCRCYIDNTHTITAVYGNTRILKSHVLCQTIFRQQARDWPCSACMCSSLSGAFFFFYSLILLN